MEWRHQLHLGLSAEAGQSVSNPLAISWQSAGQSADNQLGNQLGNQLAISSSIWDSLLRQVTEVTPAACITGPQHGATVLVAC